MSFSRNLSITIINDRIISKQSGSTPGVYKVFNVDVNTKYRIHLENYQSKVKTTLWVVDHTHATNDEIIDCNNLYYQSNSGGIVKIGVLFKSAKYGTHFDLKDIYLIKIDNPIYNPIDNPIDNDILTEYYKLKNEVNKLNITIVIPCHYKHFNYLSKLLNFYNQQTMLQKEIIIVLSQSKMIDQKYIDELKNCKYLFELKIICIEEKSPAGKNRHIGSNEAMGDIIIFQDADDIPHPQRNEIIHRCFIEYLDIDHILHGLSNNNIINKRYDINKIPAKILYHNIFNNHTEMASYKLTNGNIAIRKNIVNRVKWEDEKYRGQDVIFNKNLYEILRKYLIIQLPLYIYRENLSVKRYVIDKRSYNMRFKM